MTAAPIRLALTRAEAAEACGVKEDTIRRAVNTGKLKAKRTGKAGGKHLFTVAALEAWLETLEDA